MSIDGKQFWQVAPFGVQVLWFVEAGIPPVVIFRHEQSPAAVTFLPVAGTRVLVAKDCLAELRQLFGAHGDEALVQMGVLPPQGEEIGMAVRRFLGETAVVPPTTTPQTTVSDNLLQTAQQQRILIVDDDPKLRRLVGRTLEREGFYVLAAETAELGLEMIRRHGFPHLALVDIQLPGMNGLALCQQLHEMCDLPIMMLTGEGEEATIVTAIERYAEDYLIKPVSLQELVARIRRVLRRMADFSYTLNTVVSVDERLTIDLYQQKATVTGESVSFTPRETKILYILLRNAGRVVTRDFLQRRVWQDAPDESSIAVFVYRLRKKIEPNPKKPIYILSKRGVGYLFVAME